MLSRTKMVHTRRLLLSYQNKNKKIFSPFFFVVAKFECTKKKYAININFLFELDFPTTRVK